MSRKGEAKRRKKKMLRNKELVKRYPWIAPVDWNWNRVKGYSFTMYDDVPIGWRRAFGKIMLEDYREVLIRNNYLREFQWVQVKEKYGTLRLYSNGAPKEVVELETKYDYILEKSKYLCGIRPVYQRLNKIKQVIIYKTNFEFKRIKVKKN